MKRLAVPIIGAALIGGAVAGVGLTAFAKDGAPAGIGIGLFTRSEHATSTPGTMGKGVGMGSADIRGTVTAINGNTITVTALAGGTYTIDATNASIKKVASSTSATTTIAGIAVGDKVMIRGSITTASMTASDIFDGVPPMRGQGKDKPEPGDTPDAPGF